MSATPSRGVSWCVLAGFLAAAAILTVAGTSLAGDLLEKKRLQTQVDVQKTVAEINGVIGEARKVLGKNLAQAVQYANQARTMLADALNLPDEQRRTLGAQIDRLLQDIATVRREGDLKGREDADRESQRDREKQRQEDLAKKDSPFGKAKDFIGTGKKAIDYQKDLRDKREQNVTKIGNEVAKTAAGMVEDRFPPDWKDKLEKRQLYPLTKAEKELLRMLNSTLSVDFNKESLKNVLEFIMDKTGQTIHVEEASLKEAMIEYDTPVSIKAKKVTVRSILKKVLADVGLTFIVKEAAIQVMTPERAREHTVIRAYPIADLLPIVNPQMGPYINRVQMVQAVEQLINTIMTTVEPASWQANGAGGRGTIMFDEVRRALIVRQSAEWHYQMGGYLSK